MGQGGAIDDTGILDKPMTIRACDEDLVIGAP